MGNSLSSWGGAKRVQSIINKAGLPLAIDTENPQEDNKVPLSTFTEAYDAPGWFTGVKSAVSISKPPSEVYESLSKDLQKVFTPMTECDDEIEEEDSDGGQVIFRIVRIPFKVAFVTGNLKLRLHVEQSSRTHQIHFESAKEGRLITRFIADFDIHTSEDNPEKTIVRLDAKVNAKSLPPPPFKGMVKDVMVRKMDSCMVDLLKFHEAEDIQPQEFTNSSDNPIARPSPFENAQGQNMPKASAEAPRRMGFMDMVRSLSAPLRASLDYLDRRRSQDIARRKSLAMQGVEESKPQSMDGDDFYDAKSQLLEDRDVQLDVSESKTVDVKAVKLTDPSQEKVSVNTVPNEKVIVESQASMFKEWQKGML